MQDKIIVKTQQPANSDTSLKDLILSIQDWFRYLLSNWLVILIFIILGAGLGALYALNKKRLYKATTTFVLEAGSKGGGLGAYAGLASTLGIELGGGGGLFEGDNILELYSSRNIITQVLLSEGVFDGKRQLLIDRYIEFNGIKDKWEKEGSGKNIRFRSDNRYPSPQAQRTHDSLMGGIVGRINKYALTVEKKEKKSSIIYVTVTDSDELFAKAFNENLVQKVNKFYLDTKTKRSLENISILQDKTDSVRALMVGTINRAAAVADATPNQNPSRMAQRIAPIQNANVTAKVNEGVLGTLLQNLELSKISLLKETPLIQIVDNPIMPLPKKGIGWMLGMIAGGFIFGVLALGYLFVRKTVRDTLNG